MPFIKPARRLAFFRALIFFWLAWASAAPAAEALTEREFTHFSARLPAGWDGEEQSGFISGDPGEYLLVLGRKDEEGERFLAQVSVYLLPNKPGADPQKAAETLAEAQGGASEPVLEGGMWVFTGEPRTNVIKGAAKTMVNTDKDRMLIIIAQDPENLGGAEILRGLAGRTPEARALLGRPFAD